MSGFPSAFKALRRPIEKKIDETLETNFDRAEANQIIKYMFRTGHSNSLKSEQVIYFYDERPI